MVPPLAAAVGPPHEATALVGGALAGVALYLAVTLGVGYAVGYFSGRSNGNPPGCLLWILVFFVLGLFGVLGLWIGNSVGQGREARARAQRARQEADAQVTRTRRLRAPSGGPGAAPPRWTGPGAGVTAGERKAGYAGSQAFPQPPATPHGTAGPPGWYPVQGDPSARRHWDGSRWDRTIRWDGRQWV